MVRRQEVEISNFVVLDERRGLYDSKTVILKKKSLDVD